MTAELVAVPPILPTPQVTLTIPDTVDTMRAGLDTLGNGLIAGGWATAATVYAWTQPGTGGPRTASEVMQLSIREFAELGIRGLSSQNTVRRYRSEWESAVESGEVPPAVPGQPVQLPSRDFKWTPSAGLMSSDSPEWYTPKHVIDAVVATFGLIDLDPCADPDKSVPAASHFTKDDDGLSQAWSGRVYMNPPYGKTIGDWTTKLRTEVDAGNVTAAIALVPARTETDWWASLGGSLVCLVHGRLSFSESSASAPFPSAVVYIGDDEVAFVASFSQLGPVYRRVA